MGEVFHVVEGQGAVDQVEGGGRQVEGLQVRPPVGDCRPGVLRTRPLQHPLGKVQAQNVLGALIRRPGAEPAEAASQVGDPRTLERGQHGPHEGPFGGAVQALVRSAQPAIGVEEIALVVDVLGHRPALHRHAIPVKRSGRPLSV
jgi:hypothetical protein